MKSLVALVACMTMLLTSTGAAEHNAMTVGELQQICLGSSAESKAECRFYILGISQGIALGMNIADGRTQVGRPCVPEDISSAALELVVKMKIGEDLMVFPDDRKLDASGFVGAIFFKSFPCRKSK